MFFFRFKKLGGNLSICFYTWDMHLQFFSKGKLYALIAVLERFCNTALLNGHKFHESCQYYEIATDAGVFAQSHGKREALEGDSHSFVPMVSTARSSGLSRSLNFKPSLNARVRGVVLVLPLLVAYRTKLAMLRCVLCIAETLISLWLGLLIALLQIRPGGDFYGGRGKCSPCTLSAQC